ncbi:MAG: oligopeptide/dipeptide ABC transporter ATP-binding protein [Oscillospiraceae bacterium]
MKLCKSLASEVEASIDRLEINKDSVAYTFRTSLGSSIEKYFFYKRNNPKEEARFERQSKKRDALIAKGKNVSWKVVPKVVFDLDELKGNIVSVIDRLIVRYTEYIDKAGEVNFNERSVSLIDYFKEKASQVVYRVTKSMAKEKAIKLMEEVGIHEPRTRYYQYPFEFSGGMRQRIVIAIALAANPDIIICDEPTTALDVTIQAQILELINKLKEERNLSVIFITHDLGVVANMADDIAVMYAGKIVEYGTADDIFYDPRHPYTWALLSSMPDLDTKDKLDAIPGTPPNMIYPPKGDAFADRNKYAMEIDFEEHPPFFKVSDTHYAATWLLHPDAPKVEKPKAITDRIERMLSKTGGEQNGK